MRTIRKYEASDINEKDKLDSVLIAGVLVALLTIHAADPSQADPLHGVKRAVATLRSMLEEAGFAIVPAELPEYVKDAS